MNNPFLSLKHPNYRYYVLGMIVSNIGTWMQNVAQPWLAYQITNDAFKISLVSAMQFLPILLFSVFAGAIIEKLNKKRVLVITQVILCFTTMMFAVLVFTDTIRYWHIVVLATMMGCANAFDMPIRQSFVIQLVPKTDLMNAIALNSTVFNLARMIGPAIAGIVMGAYGAGFCFLLNSISFLAVILSLFFIKPIQTLPDEIGEKKHQTVRDVLAGVKDGFSYINKRKEISFILLSTFFVACFSMNNNVLLPVFVTDILNMQETSYGLILTCMGIGSFIGALLIASQSRKGPSRFYITYGPILIGIGLILNGIFKNYYAALLLYPLIGYAFVSYNSTANTSIQLMVKDEYRSRVMSVYSLVNGGTIPLGSLFTGIVISQMGARFGYIVNGSIVAVFMLLFTFFINRRQD